jgi:hypothetical protein
MQAKYSIAAVLLRCRSHKLGTVIALFQPSAAKEAEHA